MRRTRLMDRIGNALLAEHEAINDRHTLVWLWSGWAISTLLGFLLPIYRGTTHVQPSVVFGGAVLIMVAISIASRRPTVCLTMSAFGMVTGSAFGFGLIAALTHRTIMFAITAQLAIGAVFLGRVFVRELRPKEALPEDPFWEEVKSLPEDDARALVVTKIESLRTEMAEVSSSLDRMSRGNKLVLAGGGLAFVDAAAIVISGQALLETWAIDIVLPIAIIGLALVILGARINWKVQTEFRKSHR